MTIKQQINHGPFKTCVTCIMTVFIPLTYVIFCQFYSITIPILFTKNNKLWNKRKKGFLHTWYTVSRLLLPSVYDPETCLCYNTYSNYMINQ